MHPEKMQYIICTLDFTTAKLVDIENSIQGMNFAVKSKIVKTGLVETDVINFIVRSQRSVKIHFTRLSKTFLGVAGNITLQYHSNITLRWNN